MRKFMISLPSILLLALMWDSPRILDAGYFILPLTSGLVLCFFLSFLNETHHIKDSISPMLEVREITDSKKFNKNCLEHLLET